MMTANEARARGLGAARACVLWLPVALAGWACVGGALLLAVTR